MDHKDRPEGRLPSHSGPRQHPEILLLRSSRSSLSVPCPPVRALDSSTGIHQDISSCGPTATHSRHPCPLLLGRLDYTCAFSRTESRTYTIYQLLQSLGWTINWDKSMLQPFRILDFLGLHFNLEQALISPPDSFLPTLTNVLSRLSPTTVMPARKISSIICRMSHFAPFIYNGHLHLRFLQFWFKAQWSQHQQSWDTPIQLDADFLT